MLSIDRRDKIKDALRKNRSVTVADLSSLLKVSTETIRRDLTVLESEGFLEKTHGGATLNSRVIASQPSRILSTMLIDEKRLIASEAAKFVHPNDCLFIDNSTTAFELCNFIRQLPLIVVTTSLNVINFFSEFENIKIISPSGSYSSNSNAFEGVDTISFIQSHSFDKCFISCRSIDYSRGLCDSSEMAAEIRRSAIKSSTSSYVLMDHTKFNRSAFVTASPISDISCLITDIKLDTAWKNLFSDNDIQYIECSTNSDI